MTKEILVIYGMIERHLMAKHEACYFTGSQNYATLKEEWINVPLLIRLTCNGGCWCSLSYGGIGQLVAESALEVICCRHWDVINHHLGFNTGYMLQCSYVTVFNFLCLKVLDRVFNQAEFSNSIVKIKDTLVKGPVCNSLLFIKMCIIKDWSEYWNLRVVIVLWTRPVPLIFLRLLLL